MNLLRLRWLAAEASGLNRSRVNVCSPDGLIGSLDCDPFRTGAASKQARTPIHPTRCPACKASGHRGKELFALECEACHGLQSTGRTRARNLAKGGIARKAGRRTGRSDP